MQISKNLIDLLKTQERYAKRFGPSRVSWQRFGLPIVQLAHSVLGRRGVQMEELPGVRKCLVHLIGSVSWRSYVWVVPLPYKSVPFKRGVFGGYWDSEELSMLADSLIVTMLTYQDALWEFETNLAPIVMADVISGLERVCDWKVRGVPLDPQRNELIAPITDEIIRG